MIAIAIVTFMVNLASKADYNLNIFEKIVLLFSLLQIFTSLSIGVYLAWYRIQHYRLGSKVNDKDHDEVTNKNNVLYYLQSEKRKRKFLKWEGIFLIGGTFFMFLYTFVRFINL